MASRKRNEYLEAEYSQEDESESDFELARDSKVSRAVKRRKTSDVDGNQFVGDDHASDDSELETNNNRLPIQGQPLDRKGKKGKRDRNFARLDNHVEDSITSNEVETTSQDPKTDLVSSEPSTQKPKNKTGVVYLSRVPPFMKPATVRNKLSPYGEISRIFLTPESPTSRTARVRQGGNKKRSFVDGWVEFVHKSDAKLVAETLNANIIGGKKGGYYHDDVWNIKYLKGFKWADLTEQIKNENAERAARLRMEIAQTTRENKRFIDGFERAKMLEKMESKGKVRHTSGRDSQQQRLRNDSSISRASIPLQNGLGSKQNSEFSSDSQQKKRKTSQRKQPEELQKVLSMIM